MWFFFVSFLLRSIVCPFLPHPGGWPCCFVPPGLPVRWFLLGFRSGRRAGQEERGVGGAHLCSSLLQLHASGAAVSFYHLGCFQTVASPWPLISPFLPFTASALGRWELPGFANFWGPHQRPSCFPLQLSMQSLHKSLILWTNTLRNTLFNPHNQRLQNFESWGGKVANSRSIASQWLNQRSRSSLLPPKGLILSFTASLFLNEMTLCNKPQILWHCSVCSLYPTPYLSPQPCGENYSSGIVLEAMGARNEAQGR